jgi:MFS family permease
VLEPASIEIGVEPDRSLRRLLLATSLGSVVENYDFFLYAFVAPIAFDAVFFPKLDPIAGLIAVYATFAIGFVARPLGGVVFGHYADRVGRKAILTMTLLIMGGASVLIGCVPSYHAIGVTSPIVLVVLRFLQGFAFGGEYMNAVALNLESAPSGQRGFFASWVNASGPAGIILAVGLVSLLILCFGTRQFLDWLWRIPFLLSVVLAGLGTYVRVRLDESRLFKAVQSEKRIVTMPLLAVLRGWKASTGLAVVVNMAQSSFYYLTTVFVLGYLVKKQGISQTGTTTGIAIANVIEIVTVPLIASFSDRWGRRPFIISGIVFAAIWFPFYFRLIDHSNVLLLVLGLVISTGVVHALMFAPEAAFTAELFPTEVRVSGASLGKQLGIILGGGTAPLIATTLISRNGSFTPIIVYFEAIALLAFLGVVLAPENFKRAL